MGGLFHRSSQRIWRHPAVQKTASSRGCTMMAADVARALGGEVAGRDTVLIPGPGHSPRDRSLSIRLDAAAPDGFLIYSHAGDPWQDCRDYVRSRLGLPSWQPGDGQQ